MENASKALLMAAGMLIAVMVASIFVLMFSTMSEYTKAYDERKLAEELEAFNSQFEKYIQYKEDGTQVGATAQDVVTVINLAKSYNEKNGGNITVVVDPKIDGFTNQEINFGESDFEEKINTFLKNRSHDQDTTDSKTKMIRYEVLVEYDANHKVNKINFKQKEFFDLI